MIRTTSGDDVIATDKTSKTFIAISWLDIEKRVCKSFNSFSQAQKWGKDKVTFFRPKLPFIGDKVTVFSKNELKTV